MKRGFSAGIAALLCLCLLFLSACSGRSELRVNGTRVDAGVVSYFREEARRVSPDAAEEETEQAVRESVREYVAVNSIFADRGLTLTTAEKSAISQNVNALWRLFGTYYTSVGVSKQDIYKVETQKACRDALMADYYAPDGDEPVAEETLKAYFNENYVAFMAVTGYLTTADNNGNTVPLSDVEKATLRSAFEKAAAELNNGASVESQAGKMENTSVDTETVVLSRTNTNYPSGFFEKVSAIEIGKAGVVEAGESIFAVQRENIADEERNLFASYRMDCLKALKGEAFQKVMETWLNAYTIES